MTSRAVHLPAPFGWAENLDYSQAVAIDGLLHVAGQYAADDAGEVACDDFREQARTTFRNLERVVTAGGSSLDDLVFLRCYLLHSSDFPVYKEVRREFLKAPFPATVMVCVSAFSFTGMLIEIEAVAALPA
jgi:2-iminobutanoate/2-iminopropanoate deaminase